MHPVLLNLFRACVPVVKLRFISGWEEHKYSIHKIITLYLETTSMQHKQSRALLNSTIKFHVHTSASPTHCTTPPTQTLMHTRIYLHTRMRESRHKNLIATLSSVLRRHHRNSSREGKKVLLFCDATFVMLSSSWWKTRHAQIPRPAQQGRRGRHASQFISSGDARGLELRKPNHILGGSLLMLATCVRHWLRAGVHETSWK